MATSGDERSLKKLGAGIMDSDAGGFTADERAQTAHLLKPLSIDMNDNTGFDDDEEESDSDASALPDTRVRDTVPDQRHSANSTPPIAPTVRTQTLRVASPVKTPLIPKPRAFPSDKSVPAGKPVDPNRKRNKGKSVVRSAVASMPPTNDSETDTGRTRGNVEHSNSLQGASRHAPSSHTGLLKRPSVSNLNLHPKVTDSFALPEEPLKAVEQHDRSMDFLIQIFREMANHNQQATDVANMLHIFRSQMRPWCLKEDSADWADAAKYMAAFIGTMERVIRSCAETARARSQQRSALIPPAVPSTPLQSPRMGGKPKRISSHSHNDAPQSATQNKSQGLDHNPTTSDEMSDTHFNGPNDPSASLASGGQQPPAGLHYNQPHAHSAYGMTPPPYAVDAEHDEKEQSQCLVS